MCNASARTERRTSAVNETSRPSPAESARGSKHPSLRVVGGDGQRPRAPDACAKVRCPVGPTGRWRHARACQGPPDVQRRAARSAPSTTLGLPSAAGRQRARQLAQRTRDGGAPKGYDPPRNTSTNYRVTISVYGYRTGHTHHAGRAGGRTSSVPDGARTHLTWAIFLI